MTRLSPSLPPPCAQRISETRALRRHELTSLHDRHPVDTHGDMSPIVGTGAMKRVTTPARHGANHICSWKQVLKRARDNLSTARSLERGNVSTPTAQTKRHSGSHPAAETRRLWGLTGPELPRHQRSPAAKRCRAVCNKPATHNVMCFLAGAQEGRTPQRLT